VWQQLFDSLKTEAFMIVAIAEESRGAEHARQWIEQAGATYWCLIDTEHRVADLYGMVNVPQAVWIDEAGRIVRPPENAGSTDHFRLMDRATRTLAPEHQSARLAARTAYLDAVRDWVLTGRHALPADAAARKLPAITPAMSFADQLTDPLPHLAFAIVVEQSKCAEFVVAELEHALGLLAAKNVANVADAESLADTRHA